MIEAFSASRILGVAAGPTRLATQTAAVTAVQIQIGQNNRALKTTLVSCIQIDFGIATS
jgi:hypothetical protein